jgi:hypothetical protein
MEEILQRISEKKRKRYSWFQDFISSFGLRQWSVQQNELD